MRTHKPGIVNTQLGCLLLCILLGQIPLAWIISGTSIAQIGSGMSLDGIRVGALFSIVLFTTIGNARKLKRYHFDSEILYYGIFGIWATCSIFWSASVGYSVRDSVKLWYPVLIYILTRISVNNFDQALWLEKRIFQFIGLLILLSAGLVLAQYLLGRDIVFIGKDNVARVTDSSDMFNVGIGAVTLYIVYCSINVRRYLTLLKSYKFIVAIGILLLTVTRSYIIGTLCAVIAVNMIGGKKNMKRVVALGLLLAALSVLIVFFVNPIKQRMFWNPNAISLTDVIQRPSILMDEQYIRTSGRFTIWSYYIKALHGMSSPILGGGLGSVRYVLSGGSFFGIATPHGEYSKYIAELGWIGFIFYIVCLLSITTSVYYKAVSASNVLAKRHYTFVFASFLYIIIVGIAYTPFYNCIGFMDIIFVSLALADILNRDNSKAKPPAMPVRVRKAML